jgi:hypothetical protein
MLNSLGSLVMGAFLLAYLALCIAWSRKHFYNRLTEHENPSTNPSGNPTSLLINTFQALLSTPTGFLHLDEFISSKKFNSVLLVRDRRSQQLTTE